jgi:DNA-directed RNA polymerase specialized sigma24 family protein
MTNEKKVGRPKKNRVIPGTLGSQMRSLQHDRKKILVNLTYNTRGMKAISTLAIEEGFNAIDIAKELGVDKGTVYAWLKKEGTK